MSMPQTWLERAPPAPKRGMRRRDFIALAAGIMLARPLAALAQRGDPVRRIAVLMSSAEDDPEGRTRASAFLQGLRDLGWSDGHNLRIEWRWAGGDIARSRVHAAEIAELAPDLVVANGTANLSAVRQAIRSIPIVFVVVNDPVGQGFVSSLAHPGGNITGFTFVEYAMFGNALDLLRQVAPAARRVAVLFNPDTSPNYGRFLPEFEAQTRAHSVDVTPARVRSEAEIDTALRELGARPGGGLMVPPDTYTLANRGLIVKS